jgi:hypothetical protein
MTSMTTGPTSEPHISHTAELVERHMIVMPCAAVGGATEAFEIATLHAQAWAHAHGLDPEGLGAISLSRSGGTNGVSFDVVIGRGDIDLDQRMPGVLDRWRWSGRIDWWRRVFNRADGRQGRLLAAREDGKASVTRIHPQHGSGRSPIDTDDDLMELANCLTDEQAAAEVDRIYAQGDGAKPSDEPPF